MLGLAPGLMLGLGLVSKLVFRFDPSALPSDGACAMGFELGLRLGLGLPLGLGLELGLELGFVPRLRPDILVLTLTLNPNP